MANPEDESSRANEANWPLVILVVTADLCAVAATVLFWTGVWTAQTFTQAKYLPVSVCLSIVLALTSYLVLSPFRGLLASSGDEALDIDHPKHKWHRYRWGATFLLLLSFGLATTVVLQLTGAFHLYVYGQQSSWLIYTFLLALPFLIIAAFYLILLMEQAKAQFLDFAEVRNDIEEYRWRKSRDSSKRTEPEARTDEATGNDEPVGGRTPEVSDQILNTLERRLGSVKALEVLPIRLALVSYYSPEEVRSRLREELHLFGRQSADAYVRPTYERWRDRIARYENPDCIAKDMPSEAEAKEDLKMLRQTVTQLHRENAIGTALQSFVGYTASATAICMFLIGVVPVIARGGPALPLTVLHWSALGVSGALLSTLVSQHDKGAPEVGATEGKRLYQQSVMRVTIGAITPVLLFGALQSGIVSGKIFPTFSRGTLDPTLTENPYSQVFASIFWALMSGFAFGSLLNRLHSTVEHALGRKTPETP